MKLLLSTDNSVTMDGYTPVRSFESFRYVANAHAKEITDIRVYTFMLGMSCIYWLIDNKRADMSHIHFIINLKDPGNVEVLKQMIKKYTLKRKE